VLTLKGLYRGDGLQICLHGEHRIGNNLHIIIRQGLPAHQVHARGRMPRLAMFVFLSCVIGRILGNPLGPTVRSALADDRHGVATFAIVADLAAVRPEVEAPRCCGL